MARTVCYGCLALALPFGAAGIGFGAAGYMPVGGACEALAGSMLILTVVLAVVDMGRSEAREDADAEVVRRLLSDGTLASRIREMGHEVRLTMKRGDT